VQNSRAGRGRSSRALSIETHPNTQRMAARAPQSCASGAGGIVLLLHSMWAPWRRAGVCQTDSLGARSGTECPHAAPRCRYRVTPAQQILSPICASTGAAHTARGRATRDYQMAWREGGQSDVLDMPHLGRHKVADASGRRDRWTRLTWHLLFAVCNTSLFRLQLAREEASCHSQAPPHHGRRWWCISLLN
jgi:hypothetical protein